MVVPPNFESDLWIGSVLDVSCGRPILHNDDVASFDLCHLFGGFDERPVITAQGVDKEFDLVVPGDIRIIGVIEEVPRLRRSGESAADFDELGGRLLGEGSGLVEESAQGDELEERVQRHEFSMHGQAGRRQCGEPVPRSSATQHSATQQLYLIAALVRSARCSVFVRLGWSVAVAAEACTGHRAWRGGPGGAREQGCAEACCRRVPGRGGGAGRRRRASTMQGSGL